MRRAPPGLHWSWLESQARQEIAVVHRPVHLGRRHGEVRFLYLSRDAESPAAVMVHSKMILDDGISQIRGRMLPVKRVTACASFSSDPADAISKFAPLPERFDVPPD
jgi:hypothetical protein